MIFNTKLVDLHLLEMWLFPYTIFFPMVLEVSSLQVKEAACNCEFGLSEPPIPTPLMINRTSPRNFHKTKLEEQMKYRHIYFRTNISPIRELICNLPMWGMLCPPGGIVKCNTKRSDDCKMTMIPPNVNFSPEFGGSQNIVSVSRNDIMLGVTNTNLYNGDLRRSFTECSI